MGKSANKLYPSNSLISLDRYWVWKHLVDVHYTLSPYFAEDMANEMPPELLPFVQAMIQQPTPEVEFLATHPDATHGDMLYFYRTYLQERYLHLSLAELQPFIDHQCIPLHQKFKLIDEQLEDGGSDIREGIALGNEIGRYIEPARPEDYREWYEPEEEDSQDLLRLG